SKDRAACRRPVTLERSLCVDGSLRRSEKGSDPLFYQGILTQTDEAAPSWARGLTPFRIASYITGSVFMNEILSRIQGPEDLHKLSMDELKSLAQEMRDELVRVLSIRPAHFASNLGVVELCLALHLTYNFRQDRIIWDTGHQIYPHKLITGRYPQFGTIRTKGGLMGYPNPAESEFDLFMTGHAGCAASTALGLKMGDELTGHPDRYSVAVVGDG